MNTISFGVEMVTFQICHSSSNCSIRLTATFWELIMCKTLRCEFYLNYLIMISKPVHHKPSAYTEEPKVHTSTTTSSLCFTLSPLPLLAPGHSPSSKTGLISRHLLAWHWTAASFSTSHCQLGESSPACLYQSPCLYPYHWPQAGLSGLAPSALCSLSCLSWGLLPIPRLGPGVKGRGLFTLEKKGLWCVIFPNLSLCTVFVFLCLEEERDINHNMKDFERYKGKSLLSHRLWETAYRKCWRSLWELLLGFGLLFIFPCRERQLGIKSKGFESGKASCHGFAT